MFTIKSSLFVEKLEDLRPTQITVGFKEVSQKRKEYADLRPKERQAQMCEQLFPVVKGLKNKYFILDHHHAALAMLKEGAKKIQAGLVEDLSQLRENDFWTYLDHFSWMHVYDKNGRKRGFRDIPARLEDMVDDAYRSFAGAVRDAGGFAKPPEPFQEFLWASVTPRLTAVSTVSAMCRSCARVSAHSSHGCEVASLVASCSRQSAGGPLA